jgi:hypothetical protein
MMKSEDPAAHEAPQTPAEIAADGKLEALLDQLVASSDAGRLPDDFTARLLRTRPFAPWEVRRASAWRTPALVGVLLLVASAALFAVPLLRLGPGPALALWGWATLAALTRPLLALGGALRLLPDAVGALRGSIPSAAPTALGFAALVSTAVAALLARRHGRRAAHAAQA